MNLKNTLIFVLGFGCSYFLSAQNIVYGEYFFDDKVEYGSGISFNISAGNSVNIAEEIDISALSNGIHKLFIRFRDSNGKWSQTQTFNIFVKHPPNATIVRGEYFFDEMVAYGLGTELTLSSPNASPTEVSQALNIENLPDGIHRLFIRFLDSEGRWSQTQNFNIFVKHEQLLFIEAGEYFFNSLTEYGEGFPIEIENVGSPISVSATLTQPGNLSEGEHIIYYRFRDNLGRWSQTYSETICAGVVEGNYVTDKMQYCAGETIFFENNGGAVANATYNWDLNGDGNFNDLQTNGNSFSEVFTDNGTKNIAYQITSNLCPSFQKTDTLTIEIFPPFAIEEMISNADCAEDCTGNIDLTVTGNSQPFDYQWNTGSNSEDLTDLCAGEYFVTITDVADCVAEESFTITEPTALNVQIDQIGDEMNSGQDGFIEITASGGTPPFSFEYSLNGNVISQNEDPNNLSAGDYLLTITDANGCAFSTEITVDNIVNIIELTGNQSVSIFPNPVTDWLELDFDLQKSTIINIEITNQLGQIIFSQKEKKVRKEVVRLKMTAFPSGIYAIRLKSKTFDFTKRVVKE